jgi:HD-GYP domain-containing protein (c-di-GMP phosphodiesterase class II)
VNAREVFKAALSDLVQLFQAVSVYPETHHFVQAPLVRLCRRFQEEARRLGELTIGFLGDQVVIDQIPFLATTSGIRRLIRKMNEHGVEKLVVRPDLDAEELKRFVTCVAGAFTDFAEQEWRALRFGRITGVGVNPPPAPEADESSAHVLACAGAVVKAMLRSLLDDPVRADVSEGKAIVAAVMKALRHEEYLVDRLIRLQAHDDYTVTHSLNVCVMVVAQATRLGFPPGVIPDVGLAALLHDVGKELVPKEILNKPGKLNAEEFVRMSEHPLAGAVHLKKLALHTDLPMIVCYEHHVRYDRSGYPKVRYTEELHPVSLMTQIADVYDALRTYRPYRPSLDQATALSILREGRGKEFDPRLFDNFLHLVA